MNEDSNRYIRCLDLLLDCYSNDKVRNSEEYMIILSILDSKDPENWVVLEEILKIKLNGK